MEPAPRPPRRSHGCLIAFAIALGSVILLMVLFGPRGLLLDRPTADSPPSAADAAREEIRARVAVGPITQAEHADLEEALNDRFPQGGRVISSTDFYFDGGATSCGHMRPDGSGTIRRYVYRNRFVVAEGDMSAADLAPFWTLCEAAGAS